MISGLLKLMRRFDFVGYRTNFELPFETYLTTGDDPASILERY